MSLASPGGVTSSSRSTYWKLAPHAPEPGEHVKEQSYNFYVRWLLMQIFFLFDSIRKCKHQVAHYAQQTFRIVGLGWDSVFVANWVELSGAFAGGHNSGVLSARSSTMMIVVHMLISDQGQAESDRHIYRISAVELNLFRPVPAVQLVSVPHAKGSSHRQVW